VVTRGIDRKARNFKVQCSSCAASLQSFLALTLDLLGTAEATEIMPKNSSNLFFMTNLRPKRTGLSFVVYVSPKGNVAHGPRIKASNKYGDKASEGDWFTITIEDEPHVIGESTGLKRGDVQLAKKWVRVNKEKLLEIWEDSVDVFDADLQPV